VNVASEGDRQTQRDALWKWRWLGVRHGTPAFKGSLLGLAVAAGYILLRAVGH
jgi:hypothetical protein